MSRRLRKGLIIAAKLMLAAVLLGWVVSRVDYQRLVASMAGIRTGVLCCALAGFAAALLLTAVRFCYLIRLQDISISLWEVVRLTFLGQFFNMVVPSTVGGDLVKAYYVAKHTPKKASVLVSIFMDRMIGLMGLTAMAAIMLLVVAAGNIGSVEKLGRSAIAVAAAVAAIGLGMVFLLSGRFRRLFHLQKLYSRLPIAHHISAAGEATRVYSQRPSSLAKAVMITFCSQILWVGSIALIGKSLSIQTPWYDYYLYVPLIYIIGAVPIAPGGVGLVEVAYGAFFVTAVTGPSEVLALALVARLAQMFWGLPGAVVAVNGAKVPAARAMQAELEPDKLKPETVQYPWTEYDYGCHKRPDQHTD